MSEILVHGMGIQTLGWIWSITRKPILWQPSCASSVWIGGALFTIRFKCYGPLADKNYILQ